MKYIVLKGVVIDGKACQPGDVVEVTGRLANELMHYKKLAPHAEKATPEKEDRSIGLSEETKPKRRTKKAK